MSKRPILFVEGSDILPEDAPPGALERLTDGTPAHPDRRNRETPIGDDDRTPVSDTTEVPYRRICQISYKVPKPGSSRLIAKRGTGWLIGPRVLLTAGHVILDLVNKGDPENLSTDFSIVPGRIKKGSDQDAAPYGLFKAARLSAHPRWLSACDPDFDIGCIHLDRPVPGRVGHWGFAAFDDSALEGAEVNLAGYPVEGPPDDDSAIPIPIRHNGMKAFWHRNRIERLSPHRLFYEVDTSGGQSGAPVWVRFSAQEPPVAIGIHAYGFSATDTGDDRINSATRITPQLVQTIQRWLKEGEADGASPAPSPVPVDAPNAPPPVSATESGQHAAAFELRRFVKAATGEDALILGAASESASLGPDAGQFVATALTAAADACDAMIDRLLRRCRVQQRLDLWSSILTLVLGSSLFAASQAQDNPLTPYLGVATIIAAIVSLIAKRMGGGEGGLMAKYVDLHAVAAEARLQSDLVRQKTGNGIAINDDDIDKALATTRRLTKERGWMQASDFLFPDDGIAMRVLGNGGPKKS